MPGTKDDHTKSFVGRTINHSYPNFWFQILNSIERSSHVFETVVQKTFYLSDRHVHVKSSQTNSAELSQFDSKGEKIAEMLIYVS